MLARILYRGHEPKISTLYGLGFEFPQAVHAHERALDESNTNVSLLKTKLHTLEAELLRTEAELLKVTSDQARAAQTAAAASSEVIQRCSLVPSFCENPKSLSVRRLNYARRKGSLAVSLRMLLGEVIMV